MYLQYQLMKTCPTGGLSTLGDDLAHDRQGGRSVRLFAGQPACEPGRVVRWMCSSAGRAGGMVWPWSLMGVGRA